MTLRDKEKRRFETKVNSLTNNFTELKISIHNKRNEASLESELVLQLVISLCVRWETFINDFFIASIMMNPRKTIDFLKNRLTQSTRDKFGEYFEKCISFNPPKTLNRQKIEALLDFRGWNITAQNSEKLTARANELLAAQYARNFSFNSKDAEFYDYVLSLRNYLSHMSSGSRQRFKIASNNLTDVDNLPLKGTLNKIAPYLKTKIPKLKISRAEYIAKRLLSIANLL